MTIFNRKKIISTTLQFCVQLIFAIIEKNLNAETQRCRDKFANN